MGLQIFRSSFGPSKRSVFGSRGSSAGSLAFACKRASFRTLYEVFEREIASSPLCFARLRTWLKRRRFCERLCRCEARDGVRKNFAVSLKKRIQPKAGGSHGLAPCFAMGSLGKALARMVHNREKVEEVVCSVFLSFSVLIWWCCVMYALTAS